MADPCAEGTVPPDSSSVSIACDAETGACVDTLESEVRDAPRGADMCFEYGGVRGRVGISASEAASTTLYPLRTCAPIEAGVRSHTTADADFKAAVGEAWVNAEDTTISSFSLCQSASEPPAVCDASTITTAGVIQTCESDCKFAYVGRSTPGTCASSTQVSSVFTGVCPPLSLPLSVYQLFFQAFSHAVHTIINGVKYGSGQPMPSNVQVAVSTTQRNPFVGYWLATDGTGNRARVSDREDFVDASNCEGYCAFSKPPGKPVFYSMGGSCITLPAACSGGGAGCAGVVATVSDSTSFALPYTHAVGATLRMNGVRPVVTMPGTAVSLTASFRMNVSNAARVLRASAAKNLETLRAVPLSQNAAYEDAVVLTSDGEVAVASLRCNLTLLDVRDMQHMYSVRNMLNVTSCDVAVTDGVGQRMLSVSTQLKGSSAVPLTDLEAAWVQAQAQIAAADRSIGLSDGAVVGITAGCVAFLVVVGVVLGALATGFRCCCCCRRGCCADPDDDAWDEEGKCCTWWCLFKCRQAKWHRREDQSVEVQRLPNRPALWRTDSTDSVGSDQTDRSDQSDQSDQTNASRAAEEAARWACFDDEDAYGVFVESDEDLQEQRTRRDRAETPIRTERRQGSAALSGQGQAARVSTTFAKFASVFKGCRNEKGQRTPAVARGGSEGRVASAENAPRAASSSRGAQQASVNNPFRRPVAEADTLRRRRNASFASDVQNYRFADLEHPR